MIKVNFLLRKKEVGTIVPIHIRLTDGRKADVWGKTKETTLVEYWDVSTGLLMEKITEMKGGKLIEKRGAEFKNLIAKNKEVNRRLIDLRNTIEDAYKINKTELVNAEWLNNIINPVIKANNENKIPIDLVTYIDYYINDRGTNITVATKKKANTMKTILSGFKKKKKIKYLLIENINNQFRNEFEEYCIEEKYSPGYTARNIKFIKTICYHAEKNGLKLHFQLKSFTVKIENREIIYLSFDELKKIEETQLPHDYLENAKDWLLISCYTAQRVSDFMRFTKDMIRMEDGKSFIEFTQQKTNKIMSLPLHAKVSEILNKRNGDFPRKISSQKYNMYIKEVCKIADITQLIKGSKQINNRRVDGMYPKNELVSTHIGRRSFASNFFGIIPTSLIMFATGHSTEKMLLQYIGKTDTQKAHALAEYF
ncbi:integrase [Elizabethkingia anophelis]|nr:integrase [Elizabethkingia anophelis]